MRLLLALLLAILAGSLGASAQEPPAIPHDYHDHDHGSDHGASGMAAASTLNGGMCFATTLSGAQEVPANPSTATGSGTFVLAPDHTRLTYSISFGGLVGMETVQHIHRAAVGVNGPIVFNLSPGSPKTGTIALTSAQAADLIAGLYYVNIHSTTYPGGEIRGQILPGAGCLGATLSGAQEVPPNTSTASGSGVFALSADRTTLVYDIAFSGLTSTETVQHIHRAAAGANGPVVFNLSPGSPKNGVITLTPTQADDLQAGLYYVNIHSTTYPGGEIRGQIVPPSTCFAATLSGAQEVPANSSTATGVGTFVLMADQTLLGYHITFSGLSSVETVQHIHRGAVGVNGPVVFNLSPGSPKNGALPLTAEQLNELYAGLYYVNIHSTTYPGGELRGQIVPAACELRLPIISN
jgi:RNase P/RNase MRP subunit p29